MKTLTVAACLALASHAAQAQSLESRIANAKGHVEFQFTTRRNVCGNGMSITISDDSTAGWLTRTSRSGIHIGRTMAGDNARCEEGPGRVVITHSGSKVTDVVVTVGGNAERADTQLGAISPGETARYLLAITPALSGRSAENAVMGAAIADTTVNWKRMLDIARDNSASESARKATLFWVSQEAGSAATAGLSSVAMDDAAETSVRSDALFFLAQRPRGEGVPGLIKVVKESKSPKLRKDAIWHLSQSKDPRALDLFEQLLAGR